MKLYIVFFKYLYKISSHLSNSTAKIKEHPMKGFESAKVKFESGCDVLCGIPTYLYI
jgi:hypothetical protein